MALKDLITDLSNFKYTDYGNAGSNNSNIEGRHGTIDSPVDNSDFDNGVGFGVDPNSTPQSFDVRGYTISGNKRFIVNYGGDIIDKTMNSLYGTGDFEFISGLGGGASYYGNLNTITPRQSLYRDDSGNYQVPQEFGNTLPPGGVSGIQGFNEVQTTLNIDGLTFNGTPFIPNAQGSSFMVTPIGDTSYSSPSDSLTLDVGGLTFNGTPFIPNAQGSDFMVTPIGDTNLPSNTLTHNVGMINLTGPTTQAYQTSINVEPLSPNAHGSDFFTTPLDNYTSQFSLDDYQTNINSGFDRNLMYISDIGEPNTPTFNQFTRGDGSLSVISFGVLGDSSPNFDPFTFGTGLPYVIPQHSSTGPTEFTISGFDDTKLINNLHGSDFMTRPSFGSQISTNTSTHDIGLMTSTHPSGIGVGNITTLETTQRYSNAHSSTNSIGGLNIDANSTIYQNMDSILDPGSDYLNLGVNNNGGVGPSRDFNTDNFYDSSQNRPSVWQDDKFATFTNSDISLKPTETWGNIIEPGRANLLQYAISLFSGGPDRKYDHPTDRLPYTLDFEGKDFPLLSPDHPIITRDFGQTYGISGEGVKTSRAAIDQIRIAKILLTTTGVRFYANQQLYQSFNPREETRTYNPVAMNVSSVPMLRQNRHIGGTYENEGIDFGETSILTQYAGAIGADNPISDLIDITAEYRTTPAHNAGMVPSMGGKPQLGGQPEIILNGDNIQSLDPSQFPTSKIDDKKKFYPFGGGYSMIPNLFERTGEGRYYVRLTGTSGYSTGNEADTISSLALPKYFYGDQDGDQSESSLFKIKKSYLGVSDGTLGTTVLHIPDVYQGDQYNKDNKYFSSHNSLITDQELGISFQKRTRLVTTGKAGIFPIATQKQVYKNVNDTITIGTDKKYQLGTFGVPSVDYKTRGDRIINQQFGGDEWKKGNKYFSGDKGIITNEKLSISSGKSVRGSLKSSTKKEHTSKSLMASKTKIYKNLNEGSSGVTLGNPELYKLTTTHGDRIFNTQFVDQLYSKYNKYESNPEVFGKSDDNKKIKNLGVVASIGAKKNILFKNKKNQSSEITVGKKPISVITQLDITAPEVNTTKWKKLNLLQPEKEVKEVSELQRIQNKLKSVDSVPYPESIFYTDDIIKLSEPGVDKIVYRSDNVSLEKSTPIFNKKSIPLTDFALTGNGRGGNQGSEGQALGFLTRKNRSDEHIDSRYGSPTNPNREGFGQDSYRESFLGRLVDGVFGNKSESDKQKTGQDFKLNTVPSDRKFTGWKKKDKAGDLGLTTVVAQFPDNEKIKKGDVLNKYKTLAYGQLPKTKTDGNRYDKKDITEKESVTNLQKENPLLSHKFTTLPDGVGRVRLTYGGKTKTDKTDPINMVQYGKDSNDDYIPFKFFDIVNGKYIVFRATLSGLNESYSPEWSSNRYIGRPDQVHVYQGVNREISFDFVVAPFSKQEMLICWEKLNYLAGMTYPTWKNIGSTARMEAPFTALTIGKMYDATPGYINSLSYNVEDNVSWDIDPGVKLPQVVNVSVTFTHIGRHKLASQGKHYDLPWLRSLDSVPAISGPPEPNQNLNSRPYKLSDTRKGDGGVFSGVINE